MGEQLPLFLPDAHPQPAIPAVKPRPGSTRQLLISLLDSDLDFHSRTDAYAAHNFHSFPAKFPPQLPRKFIEHLTAPGDIVLDPMMGSGTTIVEAYLSGRRALGFDIDPLAFRIASTKVTPLDEADARKAGYSILANAKEMVQESWHEVSAQLAAWKQDDPSTAAFLDHWFALDTQVELFALKGQLAQVEDANLKAFFEVVFSAIIITKASGVSLALDLAHTRPHRAKVIVGRDGTVLEGQEILDAGSKRLPLISKTLRSPIEEFEKRLRHNLSALSKPAPDLFPPALWFGTAQSLPLESSSVDLIVTSPPYAANAIDYMRAHKFSLVWLGYDTDLLGQKRKEYIGRESGGVSDLEQLPAYSSALIEDIRSRDRQKGHALHLYYSDMTRVLREMRRVLRPGKCAILVVGSSVMRGRDTETQTCLADIAASLGLEVPAIGERNLDRNRRMMPAGMTIDLDSQIQQRMHVEYVIGCYKPENSQ